MKKVITPLAALALLMCAGSAEATSASLAFTRRNLYNAQMSAYNAKIKYYQSAALHYQKKMPALTALKYGYKLPSSYKKNLKIAKYKMPSYKSKKLVLPTSSVMKKAIGASSVSELMAALKGFGKY